MQLSCDPSPEVAELIRLECRAFAAKIRMARAVLGWSQSELALRIGLTQRGVHKLEQGETEPRRSTVIAIEFVWRDEGIKFEDLAGGGFSVTVDPLLLVRSVTPELRRRHLARKHLGAPPNARRPDVYRD